jgi:hypothetical protein
MSGLHLPGLNLYAAAKGSVIEAMIAKARAVIQP